MGSIGFSQQIQQTMKEAAEPAGFLCMDGEIWIRRQEWKCDRMDLKFKKMYFMINLYVNVPPIPNTRFEFTTLAFVNLPTLCGDSDSVYRYPSSPTHQSDVVERVERELELGIDWFEGFSNPQQCLDFLRNDKSKNPESEMFRHSMSHLERQIRGQEAS